MKEPLTHKEDKVDENNELTAEDFSAYVPPDMERESPNVAKEPPGGLQTADMTSFVKDLLKSMNESELKAIRNENEIK